MFQILAILVFFFYPASAPLANGNGSMHNLTATSLGIAAVLVFVIGYALVILERKTEVPKSIPVLIGGCAIWAIVAISYRNIGAGAEAEGLFRHGIMEYGELFLFLLVAMTYVNTLEERGVFRALHVRIVRAGLSLRQIFWVTGLLSFFLSSVADNLTTALIMGAVVSTIGKGNTPFLVVGFINVVVAANAGGAFSPFGDITTLMVWQKDILDFGDFFRLFLPSVTNWAIPAFILSLTLEKNFRLDPIQEEFSVKKGGFVIVGLGTATIAMAIFARTYLSLPPLVGMMFGLGLLTLYSVLCLHRHEAKNFRLPEPPECFSETVFEHIDKHYKLRHRPFDILKSIQRAEWDTLFFFFGVVFCINGLGALGYLSVLSEYSYQELGPASANILVGIASAVVDNIPIMFAVLSMNPAMSDAQWLLVTLTAGVGGSLLSIGSAAGVALMGVEKKIYTFGAHLRWTWAIALGYFGSIGVHFLLNGI